MINLKKSSVWNCPWMRAVSQKLVLSRKIKQILKIFEKSLWSIFGLFSVRFLLLSFCKLPAFPLLPFSFAFPLKDIGKVGNKYKIKNLQNFTWQADKSGCQPIHFVDSGAKKFVATISLVGVAYWGKSRYFLFFFSNCLNLNYVINCLILLDKKVIFETRSENEFWKVFCKPKEYKCYRYGTL